MTADTTHKTKAPPMALGACALLSIAVLWIVLVGGTARDEMIAGTGVLFLSVAFLYQVWRTEDLLIDLLWSDLVQGWRIPWYVLTGVTEIVVVLLKDLIAGKRAASLYRVSGFTSSKSNPNIIARTVLATFYTTMAPNFIVLGIDGDQNRMLFHQVKRSDVPRMTKALGAQPGVKNS